MILTGPAIKSAVAKGEITIDPFNERDLNPNSYNYHLGSKLLLPSLDDARRIEQSIPERGIILEPNHVYLAATMETLGSKRFVTLLLGRSSLGRLGLFLNITADLGHIGSCSHWTLELSVVQRLRVYPGMRIGQVSFWITDHVNALPYAGRYHRDRHPVPNRDKSIGPCL
jgi:dCTP deaminase